MDRKIYEIEKYLINRNDIQHYVIFHLHVNLNAYVIGRKGPLQPFAFLVIQVIQV